MAEDVGQETTDDAEEGDIVETDKATVIDGDIGNSPVGQQLHLVSCHRWQEIFISYCSSQL